MSRKLQSNRRQNFSLTSQTGKMLVMAAAASALFAESRMLHAASTYTGGGSTSSPLTGDWNTGSHWSPTGVPASSTTTELDFLGTSTYTSTDDITGNFQLNLMKLGAANASIVASAGDTLSFTGTTPSIQQIGSGTVSISAPLVLSAATGIQQVNGGTINLSGIVSGSSMTLSNTSGSGNSVVDFTGANTFSGLQVNANVSAIAGLTPNTTALGSGTVTLNGGKLFLQGQQSASGSALQSAIGVTGFNADTIVDALAPAHSNTSSDGTVLLPIDSDGTTGNLFLQNGFAGTSTTSSTGAIPNSGVITSTYTNVNSGHTVFDLGYNGTTIDMADNNSLRFTDINSTAQALALATPSRASTLDFLATANTAGTTFNVTLTFSDNSTSTYTTAVTTGQWAFGSAPSNVAFAGNSTYNKGGSINSGNWPFFMTESDITLTAGDANKTIDSISFAPTFPSGGKTAEIFAVSGTVFGASQTLSSQTYSNAVTVTADSDIDVSGSLAASMGALAIGSNKLSVTSSSASASAYSLTLGAATFSGNPTFDVLASTGGGAGTLNLGALSDGGTARTITINPSGTGTVALASAASSLVAGTMINVEGGVLNAINATSIGTTSTVNMSGNGTLDIGASETISALNGTSGTVALGGNTLSIGSSDNLNSSYSGLITGAGTVIAPGSGTITLGGASTYSGGAINSNGAHITTSLLVTNGTVALNASGTNAAGPAGTAAIMVAPTGLGVTAQVLIGPNAGLNVSNPITIASGNNGTSVLGGLNISGTNTFSGNVTLGTGSTGDYGHNLSVGATAGGEVDFTGNIVANGGSGHSLVTVNNLTGSGSAVVKFTGANTYSGGTTVNPNVTLVGGLSTSMTTLGSGIVKLTGGNLSLQGQLPTGTQGTVSIDPSGFNADTILDNAATTGTMSSTGTATSKIDGGSLYFEAGYGGDSRGLPASGTITSATTGHAFQLGSYTDLNTLQFRSASATVGSTLNLTTPTAYQSLDFLTSGQGAETLKVVLNFSNNTSATLGSFSTTDWYGGNPATNAVTGLDSVQGNVAGTVNNFGGPYTIQENDLTIPTMYQSLPIQSIEFIPTAVGGYSSDVYAIAGATYVAPVPLTTQTYSNEIDVFSNSDIDVSGSLNAVVGNMQIGGNTLTLSSIDTSSSPYSLTAGPVQFDGSFAGFNITNSAGGGTGTLVLGSLDDQGAVQVITKSGSGTLTLSQDATSLVNGTVVNITAGTLNSNSASALGGIAAVNVASGATFGIGASQTIASLGDYGTPVVNGSTVALNGNTLAVGTYNDQTSSYSGSIVDGSGSGALAKGGNGTLTLFGASTYSGGTTVGFGTLLIENTTGSGTGTGPVTVNGGLQALLGGTGTISGAVSVVGHANIFAGTETNTPGETAGVLKIGSGSSLVGNTILDITAVNTADELVIGNGAGSLTLGGVLDVNNPNSVSFVLGQKYTLLDFGTLTSGTFGTLNLPSLPAGLGWDTSNLYTAGPSGGYIDVVSSGPTTLLWNNSLSTTGDGVTWDSGSEGASQNWENGSSASNFTSGQAVLFNDTNNGHYTVNLTSNVLPSAITVNSTGTYNFQSTGGYAIGDYTSAATLTQMGGGTLNISNINTFTGATTVSGTGTFLHLTSTGRLASASLSVGAGSSAQIDGLLTGTPAVTANGNITLAAPNLSNDPSQNALVRSFSSLSIGAGATVTVSAGAPPLGTLLQLGSLSDLGTLDITNNKVIINYGSGPDPISSIAALIASGYNGGTWNGLGIISSLAASNHSYGVGYADYADLNNPAGLSSGQIEIAYTLLGDANLDGKVNGTDFTLMATNFNDAVTNGWDKGDFNYSNTVNGSDFLLLAGNFNQFASQSAVSSADLSALETFAGANGISLASVPEPASVGLLIAAGLGMLSRRRRKA